MNLRLVVLVVVGAMVAATLITAAFGADESPSPGVVIAWVRDIGSGGTPEPTSAPGQTPFWSPQLTGVPDSTPAGTPATAALSGFIYPLVGACLPEGDNLMPGAPREYRLGAHEGIDFYDGLSCVAVGWDTEVVAAKAGTVVRADWNYQDLTAETLAEVMDAVDRSGGTDLDALDALRGRQVWIDHGQGVVTRYAHLNGIAEGVTRGARVEQGEVIAYVGNSGTPESVTNPGIEIHLHFEIRVGDRYLGEGRDAQAVRRLYLDAFSP